MAEQIELEGSNGNEPLADVHPQAFGIRHEQGRVVPQQFGQDREVQECSIAGMQEGQAKKRRRRKSVTLSQEELDAKFPGNERNRAASQHISAAFAHYMHWRNLQEQGMLHQHLQQQEQPEQQLQQKQKEYNMGHRQQQQQQQQQQQPERPQPQQQQQAGANWRVHVLQLAEQTHEQCSKRHNALLTQGHAVGGMDEVDWVALGSMRHVLKPKLQILGEEVDRKEAEVTGYCSKEGLQSERLTASLVRDEKVEGDEEGKAVWSAQRQVQQQQQVLGEEQDKREEGGEADKGGTEVHSVKQQVLQQQHENGQQQQQQQPLQAAHQPQHLFNSLVSNPHSFGVVARAHEALVLLPPRSRFIMGNLMDKRTLAPLLPTVGCPGTYKCIVMDPPWENASVRRSGGYQQLPARQLLKLPVARLLHPDGTLFLWITNRERIWRFVRDELLPAWRLQHAATWWWLKLDGQGLKPVTPLESAHRHPFEAVLLLRPNNTQPELQGAPGTHSLSAHAMFAAAAGYGYHGRASAHASDPAHACTVAPSPCPDLLDPCDRSTEVAGAEQGASNAGCSDETGRGPALPCAVPIWESGVSQGLADGLVFISVPAAEHSRKPYLGHLIDTFAPGAKAPCASGAHGKCAANAEAQDARGGLQLPGRACGIGELQRSMPGGLPGQGEAGRERSKLELFARELHARWDAVGDEVLRFQHLSRFGVPHGNITRGQSCLTAVVPTRLQKFST